MLLSPKIVYVCDHAITILKKDVVNKRYLKRASGIDTLVTEGVIESVYSVYEALPEEMFNYYYEGIDFQITQNNLGIEWFVGKGPSSGASFNAEYTNSILSITQHKDEDCPRCAGTGWYVGIFEDNETTTKKISGISGLVQNFMKILLTTKSSEYGSDIGNIPGSEINNEDILSSNIISIVIDCEAKYKRIQLTDINAGTLLDSSERLKSATVGSVEFDSSAGAVHLSIYLLSDAGQAANINLVL